MNSRILTLLAFSMLAFAPVASAQTYYYSNSTSCVVLSHDLSYGSRDTDVSSLQRFLVSRNYPGSGWYQNAYNILKGRNLRPVEDNRSWISQAFRRVF